MELYMPKIRNPLGRFQKNHQPFNKGTKGLMKPNKTSFKKGGIPGNIKEVGFISVRKIKGTSYKWIKIADNIWEMLHRVIWEKHYGIIPAGFVIIFKDGNQMNCEIDNLECITHREHYFRNRDKITTSIKKTYRSEILRKKYGLEQRTKLRIK